MTTETVTVTTASALDDAVPLTPEQLTSAINSNTEVTGTGVFDVIMNSVRAQVYEEYSEGRIQGQEYATVYLGAVDNVLATSLSFLLQKGKIAEEERLIKVQGDIAAQELARVTEETKLIAEQRTKIAYENELLSAQKNVAIKQEAQIAEEIKLITEKIETEKQQEEVLKKQVCKLQAEYNLIVAQSGKVTEEKALIAQKIETEKAQIAANSVENSVIGRQKNLYLAQTNGYQRDAEQKAAKMMIDSWSTRRITAESTQGEPATLGDKDVGLAVNKMLESVGIDNIPIRA